MKQKELSERNAGNHNHFVNLKISETSDLNPSSSFLKRSSRLEGRQEIEKKCKDNDFLCRSKFPMVASNQFLTKKGVSVVSDFTPPAFVKHKETCNNEPHKQQKNAESGLHSHEKLKQIKQVLFFFFLFCVCVCVCVFISSFYLVNIYNAILMFEMYIQVRIYDMRFPPSPTKNRICLQFIFNFPQLKF